MRYAPATVTTASIPGREKLLAEAVMSVNDQTLAPYEHLIRVQAPGDMPGQRHLAWQRNHLLQKVSTAWLSILDDDDVYLPHHFEAISAALDSDADVVYTFANEGCVAREDVTGWTSGRLLERLAFGNCISSNSTLRTATIRDVGGWALDFDPASGRFASTGATFEDWDMWIRLARRGAKFVCVPQATWDYRGGGWIRLSR